MKKIVDINIGATKSRFEENIFYCISGCWVWVGLMHVTGYGLFRLDGKQILSHRVSYKLYKGTISNGLHVLHTCDNPICVNPDHLFLGTQRDNMLDKNRKNRQAKGEACGTAKLDRVTVIAIKELLKSGVPQRKIAEQVGVSQNAITAINNGRSWRHV